MALLNDLGVLEYWSIGELEIMENSFLHLFYNTPTLPGPDLARQIGYST
jgi:hypothetical protein